MSYRIIEEGVYSVGVIDWDRQTFDELIPLPQGTSYNSFLIKGSEKTALIDTVDPVKTNELINNLDELTANIDYIISNHAEQDHSGSIPVILEKYPDAQIVTSSKCREFLKTLLHIPDEKFKVVSDSEKLSLGDKTLEFIITPWVHWPDTMVTYLHQEKILFSCDFFGSHMATSELFGDDLNEFNSLIPAKRYYAELMMPFRPMVQNNIKKVKDLNIKIIAPSHGPLTKKVNEIITAYSDWSSNKTLKEVIIPHISMHGSTDIMVQHIVNQLMEMEIVVKPFNLAKMDLGEFLISLVDASTIIIAAPTVLTKPHPLMAQALYLVNALRPKLNYASIIGSYGWGTLIEEETKKLLENLNLDYFDSVLIKGLPREEDLKKLDELVNKIEKFS
ncbi:FprA family A-type flavoprotein [Methanobacterium alcaliphilum]|uniref:FprA family A-type flavoprotein n=1 Tax=Methanobacterium alcaliphilum TaxID=392018 RepID=UPI00200B7BC5|nr:FprA family A-type flavoprotein [Methanobacterium alcaliphilum]MCK9151648.1 FprA family A-type flavoprotein [Methanobacterium alcaliphilum]